MILPLVASMSEDARAVPNELREGSLARSGTH